MSNTQDPLQTIFTRALTGPTILKHHDALRSDYVPDQLPFRTDQISSIAQTLTPILHSSRPSNLLIYGKTGTGKTVATRYVIAKLAQTCIVQRIPGKFLYVNVRIAGTEYRVLSELATSLGLSIPFTGLALSEVLGRITQFIHKHSLRIVLVLDEIDYLIKAFGDRLIYDLTTSSEAISPGFLSIVGISNDLQFKDQLGSRVQSRLSEEELVFPPYTAQELSQILQERAQLAFNNNTYSQAALNLCAALSGSEHGDARRAVDLLRIAAEVAQRDAANQLEEKHVRIALQKIDQDRVNDALKSLPLHAKLVLLASIYSTTKHAEHSSSGTVYDEYCRLCDKNGTEALTNRRVSSLLTELDTLGLLHATIINSGRYGRTKKITPLISLSVAQQAFQLDSLVGPQFSQLQNSSSETL